MEMTAITAKLNDDTTAHDAVDYAAQQDDPASPLCEALHDNDGGAVVCVPSGVHIGPLTLTKNQAIVAGAVFIVVMGLILGFAVPPPAADPHPWDKVSSVIGWWYFTAWSVSFFPQLYLNWRRKSVVGQSFDYVSMNILGYTCYTIYTCAFFFDDAVKREYNAKFHSSNNVAINDVGFAIYALIGCLINGWQILSYDRGGQVTSRWAKAFIAVCSAILLLWVLLLVVGVHSEYVFSHLGLLYGMSIVKLLVTLIKYLPQIYLNFKRRSTVGWNIWNVLLDFTGGFLSVTQELLDAGTTGHWDSIAGNLVKFLLGSFSMVYDIIFMVQHYGLYKHNNDKINAREAERTQALLDGISAPAPDFNVA
jgi:cystinosin